MARIGAVLAAMTSAIACGSATGTSGSVGDSTLGGQTPTAFVAAARASIAGSKAYRVIAHRGDGTEVLDLNVADSYDMAATINSGDAALQVVVSGGKEYINGSAGAYASQAFLAKQLAGKWVELPSVSQTGPAAAMNTGATADCVLGRTGHLKDKGIVTLEGRRLIRIDDDGATPGGTPARMYFTSGNSPALVRIEQTGPGADPGQDPSCKAGFGIFASAAASVATYDFTWGSSQPVSAPSRTVDLNAAPFCGDPVGVELSTIAVAFLAAVFHENQADMKIGGCGCYSNMTDLAAAANQQLAADAVFANEISAIQASGQVGQDLATLAAAVRHEDSLLRAAVNSSGSVSDFEQQYQASVLGAREARSQLSHQVRADLGLPPNTCVFNTF